MISQLINPSNYYFNPYALPVFIVSLLMFSMAILVFRQNTKSIVNRTFFLKCFFAGFWLLTISIVYICRIPETALVWYRYFTFFGVVNIMPSIYFFSVVWAGVYQRQKHLIPVSYAVFLLFYILNLTTDKVVTGHMQYYFWGYYPKYGVLGIPFIACFVILSLMGIFNAYGTYHRETDPVKKAQKRIILTVFAIGLIAGGDFIPKFFRISLYPIGYVLILLYISLIGYSIVRYKAFEIETVIHKTAMWVLSFMLIIVPLFLANEWASPRMQDNKLLHILFWTVTLLILIFYLRAVQPRIDHVFQRRRANLERIATSFAEDLVYLKELPQLIRRVELTIREALYPQSIAIYIYNEDKRNYRLVNRINSGSDIAELPAQDHFLQWVNGYGKIIYKEFVDIDPAYAAIKKEADEYFNQTGAHVVVPLVLNERLLGIVNLGKKTSLQNYAAAEFHFLLALKNQFTIALSNSLVYQNIEEQVRQRSEELVAMQKQLIQAEKLATVGTLSGGVAHEINNPLTAILTNVQMLLADGRKLDDDSRESLELIEEATKRCRTIVQKLMTYAKKPLETAEVGRVDLLTVVEKVLSFLSFQLEQENITVAVDSRGRRYPVIGNQNELEQVVTNIILNARDAMKQAKDRGVIHISLFDAGDWINLCVKDEGPGIPPEIVSKIFDPFFTTKDVGKGLGLGLSICQSIVEKHSGMITVQSEEGKGTVFKIKIPGMKHDNVLNIASEK